MMGGLSVSLESGRKLGLTASWIEIIMPVIAVIATVFFFLSIFSVISAAASGSSVTLPNFSSIFLGVLILVGIMTFVGIILFVVAMHCLSQYYGEPGIFKNVLYGFILNIVGAIVAVAIEFVLIVTSTNSTSQTTTVAVVTSTEVTTQLVLGGLAVFVIGFVLGIISAVFYMRAFNLLAEKSGKDSFRTAGLLYLLGAVLTIVLVGSLLLWIAWILAATGFNSLGPREPQPPPLPPPP